jgi:group II intron reverse transcriptase/maturase
VTLLDQTIDLDNLRCAWVQVEQNAGIAGVDQVSIRVWRRSWEERLVGLRRQALLGSYKPRPLRLRRIPKGEGEGLRTLRIPTVTDRVLQRAVLQVLYPIFEPTFLDCSFGYRPGMGLPRAVERILVLRENGYRHVLDADIDDFFNQVDHELLLEYLQAGLPDRSLDRLIGAWLQVGQVDPQIRRGIPMGSPLSPLLANIYLHRLDAAVGQAGFPLARYADDFIVFAASRETLQQAYALVAQVLQGLKLRYEPAKTRPTSFDEGFEFVGVWFEGEAYEYTWENKHIQVRGDQVDWLFSRFGPEYG